MFQLNQMLIDGAKSSLRTVDRDSLKNFIDIQNSLQSEPFNISISGSVITIAASEIQTLKSDGSYSTENAEKKSAALVANQYDTVAESTFNVSTGAVTGAFATPSEGTVSQNEWVTIGFELREDKQWYIVWGTANATKSNTYLTANSPSFSGSALIKKGIIAIFKNSASGWGYSNPLLSDLITFELGGSGGASSTVVEYQDFTQIKYTGQASQQYAGHVFEHSSGGFNEPGTTWAEILAYYKFAASLVLDEKSTYGLTNAGGSSSFGLFADTPGSVYLDGASYLYNASLCGSTFTNGLALDVWIRPDSTRPSSVETILCKHNSESAGSLRGFNIQHNTDGTFTVNYASDDSAYSSITTNNAIPVDFTRYYLLTLNWDDTNGLRLWVNGSLEASDPTVNVMASGSARPFSIGADNYGGTIDTYFTGRITLLRVSDKVLDQKDVDIAFATRYEWPFTADLETTRFSAFVQEDGDTEFVSQISWDGLEVTRDTTQGYFYRYGSVFNVNDKVKILATSATNVSSEYVSGAVLTIGTQSVAGIKTFSDALVSSTSTATPIVKATTTGGLSFQNSSSTALGSYNNTGNWTIGFNGSGGTTGNSHTLYGALNVKDDDSDRTSANSLAVVNFYSGDGTLMGDYGYSSEGDNTLYIRQKLAGGIAFFTNNAVIGDISSAGAWTFGNSVFSGAHTAISTGTVQLQLKDGNASGTNAQTSLTFIDSTNAVQATIGCIQSGNSSLYIQSNASGGYINFFTGGTNIGNITDAGVWYFGYQRASGAANAHTFYGATLQIQDEDTTKSGTGSAANLTLRDSAGGLLGIIGHASRSDSNFDIYNAASGSIDFWTNSIQVGSVSSSGAWVFGRNGNGLTNPPATIYTEGRLVIQSSNTALGRADSASYIHFAAGNGDRIGWVGDGGTGPNITLTADAGDVYLSAPAGANIIQSPSTYTCVFKDTNGDDPAIAFNSNTDVTVANITCSNGALYFYNRLANSLILGTNNSARLTINSAGLYTFSAVQTLHFDIGITTGNQVLIYSNSSSDYYFFKNGGANRMWCNTSNAWFQGNNSASWSTTSDQAIKENIRDVNDCLEKICGLRPRHFNYLNTPDQIKTGFIAQEFETVLPGHVSDQITPDNLAEYTELKTIKAIDPDLLPYLVGAIKELKAKNDALEAGLNSAKERITALENV